MDTSLHDLLLTQIKAAVGAASFGEVSDEEIALDIPTDSRFGDLSTAVCMRLAKKHKRNPRDVAQSLAAQLKRSLSQTPLASAIEDIKIEGAGFLNFYFSNPYFYSRLEQLLKRGPDSFRSSHGQGKKVLLEFVSANPTGSLSVAHARQAAVGDCLANIMAFLGFQVSREYYLNDEGNQINILGNSVQTRLRQLKGETVEFPENYYQGDYIYDIARQYDQLKDKPVDVGDYAGSVILDIIKQELEDFGVRFDCWYSQKSLRESGSIQKALDDLRSRGHIYDRDGAVWFQSTAFGDDKDRVVIKSDGSHTYLAPDIAYHQEKYRRGYQWLINIWGPDHHGYISRIKAAVEALGYPADSVSVLIVQLATIYRNGAVIEMSTRKGQYISLREVLDEVGKDAARFFFLMRRTSSHLDFDLDVAKKQSAENPVYYVQYAYARIGSILRNASGRDFSGADLSLLKEKEEIALIKKIMHFPWVLSVCCAALDPYLLTVYLQELSEAFHKFYDAHRVLGSDAALSKARLALVDAVRLTIGQGLDLAGVSKPDQM